MSERNRVVQLSIGSRIWWHGDFWEVRGLRDGRAELALRGQVATVAITDLAHSVLEHGDDAGPEADEQTSGALALASLSPDARAEIERLAVVIRDLLGNAAPLAPRLTAAADQLGISPRSLERRIASYRRSGVAGLAGARATKTYASRVDPRWDEVCKKVLRSYTYASTPTRSAVIARVAQELEDTYGFGVVPIPHDATAYRRLKALSHGKYSFGGAKGRRSVAERPEAPYGRMRADRPGQYVVVDTNDLDVFAMEPATLRWVRVQLTVAMDLYSRCVLGLTLTPISTKSADIAHVLYQCVRPGDDADPTRAFPYHGVPGAVLIGTEVPDERLLARTGGLPAVFPESIVVDRGKQYISSHVISACSRLGISVQPANPRKATDKPTIERFFGTLRTGLLQHLPAYKGRTFTPEARTSRARPSSGSLSWSRSSVSGLPRCTTISATTDSLCLRYLVPL